MYSLYSEASERAESATDVRKSLSALPGGVDPGPFRRFFASRMTFLARFRRTASIGGPVPDRELIMDIRICMAAKGEHMLRVRRLGRFASWNLTIVVATGACFAQGVISTVAGNGANAATGDGGPALSASFHPDGLTVDRAGNIYNADQHHNRIRKVDPPGIITTVAGNGNTQFSGDGGPATNATVYIAGNHNG